MIENINKKSSRSFSQFGVQSRDEYSNFQTAKNIAANNKISKLFVEDFNILSTVSQQQYETDRSSCDLSCLCVV